MRIYHLIILIVVVLQGCIQEPTEPGKDDKVFERASSVFILCEGNWGMDNSVLMKYDIESENAVQDFFAVANPGLKLGDIANDIVLHDSTALIAVTTARTVEVINATTGKSSGRIIFDRESAPRRIAIINDSLAAVTDLYRHSIAIINYRSLLIVADKISVGPAPEGIAYYDGLLFVVNSGYGDYLADRPKAGTVSLVSVESLSEVGNFVVGPNPIEILIDKTRNKFYVSYKNLPSRKDSLGGIVEYSLLNMAELRRVRTDVRSMVLTRSGDSLVFATKRGVEFINLKEDFKPDLLIQNNTPSDIWYSVACDAVGTIWVGNAKNHMIKGDVLVYAIDKQNPIKKIPAGCNPGKILFFNIK
jgi:hypothetical protein